MIGKRRAAVFYLDVESFLLSFNRTVPLNQNFGGSSNQFFCLNALLYSPERTVFFSILKKLKVHKIENFFDSDFGICIISLLVMSKY